ncbi:hypothetical protein, partial [Actinomadura sp. CNU-125]|uniref:hypothetical protein n=1 Tax=Actinomadura sp. CNU-125 TaxID=1904961 RepID=UPI002915C9C2
MDRQPLKHRVPGEPRPAPIHPEFVTLLRDRLKEFNIPAGGRLFVGGYHSRRGNDLGGVDDRAGRSSIEFG